MNSVVEMGQRTGALQTGGSVAGVVPQNLDEAFRLSTAISQSGMAPYGLETPQKVMIAMLAGMELGMPPMQSVQSVAVINNRPCMWGDALIGIVRGSGLVVYFKEWIEGEGDARVAHCETLRRGEAEPVRRSFSVADAKAAGLWQTAAMVTKKRRDGGEYTAANDSPWFKYQPRMLQMRARGYCIRDVYPDVLKGVALREEVEDYTPSEPRDITPATPGLAARLSKPVDGPSEGFTGSITIPPAPPPSAPADEPAGTALEAGSGVTEAPLGDATHSAQGDAAPDITIPLLNAARQMIGASRVGGDWDADVRPVLNGIGAELASAHGDVAKARILGVVKHIKAAHAGELDWPDAMAMIAGLVGVEEHELEAKQ